MEPAYNGSTALVPYNSNFINPPTETIVRPLSPASLRLKSKIELSNFSSQQSPAVNWEEARVFTPDKAVGYKSNIGIQYFNGKTRLFVSGNDSQGLIFDQNHKAAASVTTAIKVPTVRKNEKKATFIQYDKNRFEQDESDFKVTEKRNAIRINYEGGHLIDYKFGADGSHTTSENYFPQHYVVNAPLKEYIIQRSEAYIEIPLYTPTPPTVGVKSSQVDQPIPVGDLLIQINKNEITNVYYFPNNNFDYKGVRARTTKQKTVSETLLPYFKLKPCFHALLNGALITDFKKVLNGKDQQTSTEQHFLGVIDRITDGMVLGECHESQEAIKELAYKVLHEDGKIDPSLIYDCNEAMLEKFQDEPLDMPLKMLGEFLVKYALRNALKSEVISTTSRLIFLNVIIDFIEASTDVSESLDFIDSLADDFKHSFEELEEIRGTMSQQELFFFADTYRRLSSEFNHDFSCTGYKVYFAELDEFLNCLISVMEQISQEYPIQDLKDDYAQNFLSLAMDAQDVTNYLIESGIPSEELEKELSILRSFKIPCIELFDKLPIQKRRSDEFQTNHKQTRIVKRNENYVLMQLRNLGSSPDSDSSDESSSVDKSGTSNKPRPSVESDSLDKPKLTREAILMSEFAIRYLNNPGDDESSSSDEYSFSDESCLTDEPTLAYEFGSGYLKSLADNTDSTDEFGESDESDSIEGSDSSGVHDSTDVVDYY